MNIENRMIVIAHSIGVQTLQMYQFEAFLANYTKERETLDSLDKIDDAIFELEKENFSGETARFMRSYLKALKCYIRVLQGDEIGYDEIMAQIQEIPVSWVSDTVFEDLRQRVEKQLTDAGFKGTLGEKIEDFEEQYRIPVEKVVAFAEERLQESKEESEKIFVPLPKEDGINSVDGVTGVFWSGYSQYLGSHRGQLKFNLDRRWSAPSFVNVLVHEGYPGHQYMYSHWEELYKRGTYPEYAAWYLLGTPANSIFEGVAENACHFLGWDDEGVYTPFIDDGEKRRIILARDIADLKRVLQTNACFAYHQKKMTGEESLAYMQQDRILTELEARNCYRFYSNAIQKLTYPSYYYGKWLVRKAYDQCLPEKRNRLFQLLYEKPLSNQIFIEDYEELTGIKLEV